MDNEQKDPWWFAIVATVSIIVVGGLILWGIFALFSAAADGLSKVDWSPSSSSASQNKVVTPTERPITKVECDWTGFMSATMIDERAKEGYFYTGRTTTWWCEDAMVFQLRDVPTPVPTPLTTASPEVSQ